MRQNGNIQVESDKGAAVVLAETEFIASEIRNKENAIVLDCSTRL